MRSVFRYSPLLAAGLVGIMAAQPQGETTPAERENCQSIKHRLRDDVRARRLGFVSQKLMHTRQKFLVGGWMRNRLEQP